MRRSLYQKLLEWKTQSQRKPLLLKGARQVGKTFLLKSFGELEFKNHFHFDFIKEPSLNEVFEDSLKPSEIIQQLNIRYELNIDLSKDLIIFDEIQACPKAVTALKYFCEDCPQAYVVGSGSFLGISLTQNPYPVGKVQTEMLYPMNFFEFLEGLAQDDLKQFLIKGFQKKRIPPAIHAKVFEYLKYYFITGGLPEVVQTFKKQYQQNLNLAFESVRTLQDELIRNYRNDMAKHSGKVNAVKIQSVFDHVPLQLARENKNAPKFVFKGVLPNNSNYRNLEDPITWLVKAGLIYKVLICKKATPPLKAYSDENKFKLYLFDVGLLGAMTDLKSKDIYSYDYGSYKGFFAENFFLQEFYSYFQKDIYSWNEGTSEIEFLTDLQEGITPIEVKAGINTKAKSLKVFIQKYQPHKSYLFSLERLERHDQGLNYVPLYLVSQIE